jgi:hypothetical protein
VRRVERRRPRSSHRAPGRGSARSHRSNRDRASEPYGREDLEDEATVLREATRGQRAIYALDWTTLEVNNGGWHQFFWNSSGALTDEAIAGAELIGARENAAILREAAAVFPRGQVPEDRSARWRALDSISDAEAERVFGPLETRWYARDLQLERLMVAYIEANPDEFLR